MQVKHNEGKRNQMKTTIVIVLALFTELVNAQDPTFPLLPKKGNIFVNGQFTFGYNQSPSNFNLSIAPGLGYFFRDNKSVGARVGLFYNSAAYYNTGTYVNVNPFGRKYYYVTLLGVKAALIAEAGFSLNSIEGTPWRIYLAPSFALFPHKHWAFELNLASILYLSGFNGDVSFGGGVDISRSSGISVAYFIGK